MKYILEPRLNEDESNYLRILIENYQKTVFFVGVISDYETQVDLINKIISLWPIYEFCTKKFYLEEKKQNFLLTSDGVKNLKELLKKDKLKYLKQKKGLLNLEKLCNILLKNENS